MMKISWLGHACFLIESDGVRIITDPYDERIGFTLPKNISADIVTVSHSHFDHSATAAVGGNPIVIDKAGESIQKGIKITGIQAFHDNAGGAERGINIIFKFTAEEINICHLGDLGHTFSPEELARIGPVDILMIPVGGAYSLNAQRAKKVVEELNPIIILPMHYKEENLSFELEPVENFLDIAGLEYEKKDFLDINQRADLGKKRIIILTKNPHRVGE